MSFRATGWTSALLLGVITFSGCSKWKFDEAPAGFAIVREHVIDSPRNDPPISSALDLTIIAIDGAAVTRETVPPWIDIQRGALVPAGSHSFKALVMPYVRRPGDASKEVSFIASVESKKVYDLVDKDRMPVLIEVHLKTPNQPLQPTRTNSPRG